MPDRRNRRWTDSCPPPTAQPTRALARDELAAINDTARSGNELTMATIPAMTGGPTHPSRLGLDCFVKISNGLQDLLDVDVVRTS